MSVEDTKASEYTTVAGLEGQPGMDTATGTVASIEGNVPGQEHLKQRYTFSTLFAMFVIMNAGVSSTIAEDSFARHGDAYTDERLIVGSHSGLFVPDPGRRGSNSTGVGLCHRGLGCNFYRLRPS